MLSRTQVSLKIKLNKQLAPGLTFVGQREDMVMRGLASMGGREGSEISRIRDPSAR